MKKSIIFFGLMIVSTIIFAQRRMDPMERAAKQAERMKTELGLDEVQHKAVKAIHEDHAAKLTKVWRDSTMSKETKHQQMKALHNERETALRKVLTEEQHKKLMANRSDHLNKQRTRMAAQRNSDYTERLQKELSLTHEQTDKVKSIHQEFGQKLRSARNDSTMSKEDNKARMKQLRSEYHKKMKTVLTEEQFNKWEKLKSDQRRRRS